MHLSLNREERDLFAAWLRQEESAHLEMAEQMDKLPHCQAIAKRERAMAAAKALVASGIERTEEEIL